VAIPLVSEASFERDVLASELPVLVDLYADWCQPCKQLTPILEQVASELSGKLRVVRIDVERSPRIAAAFRVQSIPMLVLIAGGRPVDQVVGLVDKQTLLQMVAPVLPAAADEVAPKELAQLLQLRRAVAVDVRDASAFARYHIPGALHLAAADILGRVSELRPTDGRLRVLYGRSGDEAKELAGKVRDKGVEVGFLTGGFLHWEAEGLEVERGA
jgi:thioredoxin